MSAPEPLIDALLAPYAARAGADFGGYRNHVQRVFHFCLALAGDRAETDREIYAVAAAFHDLGIFTTGSLDYLAPSRALARDLLTLQGKTGLAPLVEDMIESHHALLPRVGDGDSPTEIFRRADLVDLSLGAIRHGIPAAAVAQVRHSFPNAGFHRFLVRAFARRTLVHPLSLAPMLKWRPGARK